MTPENDGPNRSADEEPDWDDISYVISSQYRTVVLRYLAEGPSTPSQLADETDHAIANVSRALKELRGRSLVRLLVSEDRRKGRVYGITALGTKVWVKMESEGLV